MRGKRERGKRGYRAGLERGRWREREMDRARKEGVREREVEKGKGREIRGKIGERERGGDI